MSQSRKLSHGALLGAAAFGALALASTLGSQPARADECLLDTNNNGVADPADSDGGAQSAGDDARLACGFGASAGTNGTAVGPSAHATGTNSTALGSTSTASGFDSTALGRFAGATGAGATSVGTVPSMNSSVIFFWVYGPGSCPL